MCCILELILAFTAVVSITLGFILLLINVWLSSEVLTKLIITLGLLFVGSLFAAGVLYG